jgi:REP element-mobilizing transposase RayT
MLRGNDRQAVFFDDQDRARLLALVEEGVARFGHRVHAFCLMSNHLHLAVQVADVPLAKVVQNLAFRYTRWVNRRQGRVGHLFQGRYKALLVDGDAYVLSLVRYIHLNPVRAGLVEEPADYPWSGHRAYLGLESLPWLTTAWVLGQFGEEEGAARRRYGEFVGAGLAEGHREEFHRGGDDPRVLGPDDFLRRTLSGPAAADGAGTTLDALVARVAAAYGLSVDTLAARGRERRPAEARAVAAALAVEAGAATLSELARRFQRDVATLSEAVQGVRDRLRHSPELRERYAALRAGGGDENQNTEA